MSQETLEFINRSAADRFVDNVINNKARPNDDEKLKGYLFYLLQCATERGFSEGFSEGRKTQ